MCDLLIEAFSVIVPKLASPASLLGKLQPQIIYYSQDLKTSLALI